MSLLDDYQITYRCYRDRPRYPRIEEKRLYKNRWFNDKGFPREGKAKSKRIPIRLEWLRPVSISHYAALADSKVLPIVKYFRQRFPQLSLADATCCAVAFWGVYDNDKLSAIFTTERYDRGMQLLSIFEKIVKGIPENEPASKFDPK